MSAKFTIGEKSLLIDDVPVEKVQAIATRHSVSWLDILYTPAQNLEVFRDVVKLAAATLEVDPPPMGSVRDCKAALDMLSFVDDDRPVEYADGNPPLADDQKTA